METSNGYTSVHALTITQSDALDAGITMLGNVHATKEIAGNNRLASGTLNAFLFNALRNGWLRDDVESFRASVYEATERRGFSVNTRSNSVLTATSRAAGLADRHDRFDFLNVASSLNEALKLQGNRDAQQKAAEEAAKAAAEAHAQAEADQRQRDEQAIIAERELAASKADGSYAQALAERIGMMLEELESLGIDVSETFAKWIKVPEGTTEPARKRK